MTMDEAERQLRLAKGEPVSGLVVVVGDYYVAVKTEDDDMLTYYQDPKLPWLGLSVRIDDRRTSKPQEER